MSLMWPKNNKQALMLVINLFEVSDKEKIYYPKLYSQEIQD